MLPGWLFLAEWCVFFPRFQPGCVHSVEEQASDRNLRKEKQHPGDTGSLQQDGTAVFLCRAKPRSAGETESVDGFLLDGDLLLN